MSEPSRLVDGTGPFESGVLRSWGGRQPSEAARRKTLAALGVGGLLATGGAGASMAPKAVVISSSVLKWLGVGAGLAATAGVVGYATQVARQASVPAATGTSSRAPDAPRSSATVDPVAAPLQLPTAARDPVPPAPTARSAAPAAAGGAARAPAGTSLDEEVFAIDQARRALAGGDPAAALRLVDAYDVRYRGGALAQESAELRVEALYRAGRRAQADTLAARFLAEHPASPYARVIRALQTGAAPASP